MYPTKLVKLEHVIVAEDRQRKDFGDIDGLAESIKQHGVLQPPLAVEQADGTYKLVAGERRLRAVKQLGMLEIPLSIMPATTDELTAQHVELVENIQRKNLSWDEEVLAKKRLHDLQISLHGKALAGKTAEGAKEGWSIADTAKLLNESRALTNTDLLLAAALQAQPELAKSKTKDEARSQLKRQQGQRLMQELAKRTAAATTAKAASGEQTVDIRAKLFESYIIGDFFKLAPDVPAESVNCIMLDWPYGVDISGCFGTEPSEAALNDLGSNMKAEDYLNFMQAVVHQCKRILKPNGWLLVWYAMHPWHGPTVSTLEAAGFTVRPPVIWDKGNGNTREPRYNLRGYYEPMLYAAKGLPQLAQLDQPNIIHVPKIQGKHKLHPTEKPVELLEKLYKLFCLPNHKIFVPFLGSGNDLLAAANCGLEAFGFELNEDYKAGFALKLKGPRPFTS